VHRPRLSYANVVSSLALFVALGGTSYAVSQLPRNSVGSQQLKRNAVTSVKIRARAVQRTDLAPSARVGSRGARGAVGPIGPSETIQIKRPDAVAIPPGGGGAVTLAKTTIPAGSWMFNAQTRVVYSGTTSSEFFDCYVTRGGTERLGEGTLHVGEAPQGVVAGSIPTQFAATFPAPTELSYVCWHPSPIPGAPRAERTTLLATRVGALEERSPG
jgi:hypothetical protein